MSFYFVLICGAVLLQHSFVYSASLTLPNNFTRCKKDDPNFTFCVKNAAMDAIRKMRNDGLPSLGIYPLDPLLVEEMRIYSGAQNSPINLGFNFKNLLIKGTSDSNITTYDIDLKGAKISANVYSPKIVMESDYVADGRVMLLPVTGRGRCRFTFDELETENELIFKPEKKNGELYWIIQDYIIKFKPKRLRVYFDGLLNGDKRLNEGINRILNENWEIFLGGILPQIELSCGAIFKEITSRIFNKVSIDNIFY